ncbi:MAG: hypothetical protein AAFZ05_12730 [Pseudomonadota bacterium]
MQTASAEDLYPLHGRIRSEVRGGEIAIAMRPDWRRIAASGALDVVLISIFLPGLLSAILALSTGSAAQSFQGMSGPAATFMSENANQMLLLLIAFQCAALAIMLPGAWRKLTRLFMRRAISISDGAVVVDEHRFGCHQRWQLPVSEFMGVRRARRQAAWSDTTVLELAHRDPARTVVLYAAPVVPPSLWEAFARKLDRPLIDGANFGRLVYLPAEGSAEVDVRREATTAEAKSSDELARELDLWLARAPRAFAVARDGADVAITFTARRANSELGRLLFLSLGMLMVVGLALSFGFAPTATEAVSTRAIPAAGSPDWIEQAVRFVLSAKFLALLVCVPAMLLPMLFVARCGVRRNRDLARRHLDASPVARPRRPRAAV